MLDDLVRTLETLRSRIKEHGPHIGDYEKRTRVALIDPLLCALGWDVSDPRQVEVETRTEDGWADYALLGSNGRPFVFIEAKKLADKNAPIRQTIGYAISENMANRTVVQYCVYTNGDLWNVLDITSQKSLMEVSITRDNVAKCALKLLGLWRSSLLDGKFEAPVDPLTDAEQFAEAEKNAPPLHDNRPVGRTPLDQVSPSRGAAPREIWLPDGSVKRTTYWYEVIVEAARWLLSAGELTAENCEQPLANGKHLFSRTGEHPTTGKKLQRGVWLGDKSVYLDTNLSAQDVVRFTMELLTRFGYEPTRVSLTLPVRKS